jgi:adenylate cyclase
MLSIRVTNDRQRQQIEHLNGPIELGRGPQRDVSRFVIDDHFVSRDQLRVEELPEGRVRIENLSLRNPLSLPDGSLIAVGACQDLHLPVRLMVGKTAIDVRPFTPPSHQGEPTMKPAELEPSATLRASQVDVALTPVKKPPDSFDQQLFEKVPGSLRKSGMLRISTEGSPGNDTLAVWLETVIGLQQAAAGSAEFYAQTARALGELVGLDLALVLLRRDEKWTIVGSYVADDKVNVRYSKTLLDHVVAERQTFYQDMTKWQVRATSMVDIEAAVVSPIFGVRDDVVGVLYGMRSRTALQRGGIQPLEAQLVQLLAAAVGSNLARSEAMRTRIQFEQFFSPELVRELERDPELLEGRNLEVTILVSDLRGFTSMSQRLGAQNTYRMLRDMMERLSARVVEHGGVIVDYAGDGILAMWNAPARQEGHAVHACEAALAMLEEMPGLNKDWYSLAEGGLALGIGINTGPAQVGNSGSNRKFKYGPHGHTVNLASRVQDATKKLGLPLLITGPARDLLPPVFATRRLGQVRLPGVRDPVILHELHGKAASEEWLMRRNAYEAALVFYETRQWGRACQTLMPLLEEATPDAHFDKPVLKLMRRAWECLETPPEVFDPIIEVSTK